MAVPVAEVVEVEEVVEAVLVLVSNPVELAQPSSIGVVYRSLCPVEPSDQTFRSTVLKVGDLEVRNTWGLAEV